MALHRYGDFRVEVFYFDSPCMDRMANGLNANHCVYMIILIVIFIYVHNALVFDILSQWDDVIDKFRSVFPSLLLSASDSNTLLVLYKENRLSLK